VIIPNVSFRIVLAAVCFSYRIVHSSVSFSVLKQFSRQSASSVIFKTEQP